jgi:murein DD-endopeptidase MepM/ murein hydrolase activator NlpD
MILHPIQNKAVLKTDWIQSRPRITQPFGLNPQIYSKFGMKGHNGIDFGIPTGTKVFAPMDGIVKVKDDGINGYGLHVKIRNEFKASEIVLAHLSRSSVQSGQRVNTGDLIGYSGNTGFSTGPHLHVGLRNLKPDDSDIFKWRVLEYDNGYKGYVDFYEFLVTWKGNYLKNTL